MGWGKYHNPENYDVVTAEGKPTPSNESSVNYPSTEAAVDPKLPYTTVYVWVK